MHCFLKPIAGAKFFHSTSYVHQKTAILWCRRVLEQSGPVSKSDTLAWSPASQQIPRAMVAGGQRDRRTFKAAGLSRSNYIQLVLHVRAYVPLSCGTARILFKMFASNSLSALFLLV